MQRSFWEILGSGKLRLSWVWENSMALFLDGEYQCSIFKHSLIRVSKGHLMSCNAVLPNCLTKNHVTDEMVTTFRWVNCKLKMCQNKERKFHKLYIFMLRFFRPFTKNLTVSHFMLASIHPSKVKVIL